MSACVWSTPGADGVFDWDGLVTRYDWIARMKDCPQDPRYHAEGDVLTHTRMVAEAMATEPAFVEASAGTRRELFGAALLHDVAKPWCTRTEDDGRITSPGHSPQGAREARRIAWRLGVDFGERERMVAQILFHQVPYHALADRNPDRKILRLSQTAVVADLCTLARADVRGRICEDRDTLSTHVEMFEAYADELGCRTRPFAYPSGHTRVRFSTQRQADPRWQAYDETRCEVTVLSGLPGAGKSTWIDQHAPDVPRISLDAIRRAAKVRPDDEQGAVVAAAKDKAREYLRAGQDFVWDATNLSRSLRRALLGLLYDYDARVHLVYVEVDEPTLRANNRARPHAVPDAAMDRLIGRWEVPDFTEAHRVSFVVGGQPVPAPVLPPDCDPA